MSNLDFLSKNSNIHKIDNNNVTKKRRRKTVETTIETTESILTDVNKIRLSKSDDTFDLKLHANEILSSHNHLMINDQIVPVLPSSDQVKNGIDNNLEEFKNFNEVKIYKQIDLVSKWFKNLNDQNKNSVLSEIMNNCGSSQKHVISIKLSKLHSECPSNCCDMLSHLPRIITFKIFSYLEYDSLVEASKVCKLWNNLASDSFLWKRFCFLPRWRFSSCSENKQLIKYTNDNNYIDWKSIFTERYRIKSNWYSGRTHVRTFYGHDGAISCVQFDDLRIVAGSTDGSIKVWNIKSSSPYYSLNLLGHSGTIRCLHLDGELHRLISGSADHTIKIWNLSELHPTWSRVTCKMTLLGHSDIVRCLQVNASFLISGSYDHTLKLWCLKTGTCTNTLRGHTDAVLCLQFDNEKIISGSADRSIRIWNFTGECLRILQGHAGSVTCLHFDSQRIISGSLDFDIKFWSIDTGECINTLDWITKEGHTGVIRCLKADSQKILSCSDDKTIKIWNIETGERYVTLRNHTDGVTCLQFNDYYILSGSYDRTIKLWDFSI